MTEKILCLEATSNAEMQKKVTRIQPTVKFHCMSFTAITQIFKERILETCTEIETSM